MKKIILILVLQMASFIMKAQTPICLDFADGSMHGWTVNTNHYHNLPNHYGVTAQVEPTGGSNGSAYLKGSDENGQSFMYNATDYSGDWTQFFNAPCPNFCWDFKVFDYYNSSPVHPSITISTTFDPAYEIDASHHPAYWATFTANNLVTDDLGTNPGWHHYCAPIAPCDNSGNMPSNSYGTWTIWGNGSTSGAYTQGTCADWIYLLQNVQCVRISFDYTVSPSEKIGYDQLCLADCGDHNDNKCCSNFFTHVNASILQNNLLNVNFSAGPKKIKKIIAEIVDFSVSYNDPSTSGPNGGSVCAPCVPNSDLWGNFSVANPSAISVFGLPGRPSVPNWSTSIFSREIVWGSSYGPGINMTNPSPTISIPLSLPPRHASDCCTDTIRFCIRYKFTDIDCITCDTLVCYKIIRVNNSPGTRAIETGFVIPSSNSLSMVKQELLMTAFQMTGDRPKKEIELIANKH